MSAPQKAIQWVKDGECMMCTSHRPGAAGYPEVYRNGKRSNISRLILCRRHSGKIDGLVARHSCDRRNCINPAHIVIGTIGDNNRDIVARGRYRGCFYQFTGKTKPWAKLTEAQVVEIRALLNSSMPRIEIQRRFGINGNSLFKIRTGKSWKHVPLDAPYFGNLRRGVQ